MSDLIQAIVQEMHASEHHITDQLIESYRAEAAELRARVEMALGAMYDAEVMDRTTRARLFAALVGAVPADYMIEAAR